MDLDNIPTAPLVACTPSVSSPISTFPPRYSGVDLVSVLAFAPRLCRDKKHHPQTVRRGKRASLSGGGDEQSDGFDAYGTQSPPGAGETGASSPSFFCGPPRTFTARACRPCAHVHNGFLVATRPGSPLLRRLADFMMAHPSPERGSAESPSRLLLYHFYVRNFYLTLLRDLRRSTLRPGVVYEARDGERVLLVDAVGLRRRGGDEVGDPVDNRTTTATTTGISRCMRMGVKTREPEEELPSGGEGERWW